MPKEWFWLRGFVRKLKKLGCEYELVRYEGVAPPADEDSDPAAGPPSQPPASEEQTDEVLAQVEKLGELHQAGILTDEEFQSKKVELLSRL